MAGDWGPGMAWVHLESLPATHTTRCLQRCLTQFQLMGFSVTCFPWVFVFVDSNFLVAWMNGGPVSLLYGWVIAMAGTALVTLSLAEVASACPNIGGECQLDLKAFATRIKRFCCWEEGGLEGWCLTKRMRTGAAKSALLTQCNPISEARLLLLFLPTFESTLCICRYTEAESFLDQAAQIVLLTAVVM